MTGSSADGPEGLRLATRGSPLALWQAGRVAAMLSRLPGAPRCEPVVVRTTGDTLSEVPVSQLGGQGAFVKEVQWAVLDGRADLAVHSAKASRSSRTRSAATTIATPSSAKVRSPLSKSQRRSSEAARALI